MFWGDHNPSADGAVTPYNGSDNPSGGSPRRAGLAEARFHNPPKLPYHQTDESALTSIHTPQQHNENATLTHV